MVELTKTYSETYHFKGGQIQWANITLGSKDNSIDIKSDWGNYSTAFSSPGNNFKKFLVDLDESYLAGRFHPPKHFDGKASLEALKKEIKEARLYSEDEQLCLEQVESGPIPSSIDEYFARYWRGPIAEFVFQDPYLPVIEKQDGKWRGFMDYVWPEFIKELKRELKSRPN